MTPMQAPHTVAPKSGFGPSRRHGLAGIPRNRFIVIAWLLCQLACRGLQITAKPTVDFHPTEILIQQHRLEEAKAMVLEQIEADPSKAEGYILLGLIESDRQDFPNALIAFQNALQRSPNSTRAHLNLGNVYVAQKRPDLAEREFRTVLRLAPGNQDASYNLGTILMAKGSFEEAIVQFNRVQPASVPTRFNLIQANFETHRTAAALRMATELSSQNEGNVQVHFTLGLLLATERQFRPAQSEFLKADALKPDNFDILYNLGVAFYRSADFPRADSTLSKALRLNPESSETLFWLANSSVNQSRPLDALDFLVRARKLAPQNPDILFLMAQVSISQNYFEDAIPLLESSLQLAPSRNDIRSALGESYFMAGRVDQAIAEFRKVIDAEPSPRSYAFLGLSYRNLGRFDEAARNFQQGLKLDPHDTACLFNLGFIAQRQGDAAAAESRFQEVLHRNPNYPDALLELANLRIQSKRFQAAEELLRRYVDVSRSPATGYYKLAMLERSLHENAASDRDLAVFQNLSKDAAPAPHNYEHLLDYVDSRAQLAPRAREQLDLEDIQAQVQKHPDQPEALYLLVEAYLKAGKLEEARRALAQLDQASASDYRTLTGVGVLLARYHLYDESIQHFQAAIAINPDSDEQHFDLADAYFRKGLYSQARDAAERVSTESRKEESYLALIADIDAHLGDTQRAAELYRDAIGRNPDNDQDYLSLALLQFRLDHVAAGKEILVKGQSRVPGSGKILWGLGIASVLEGNTSEAADRLEQAVELLPEWSGSYSTLGVFYFETGQIEKAREVLSRFKSNRTEGGLNINKIEQVLAMNQLGSHKPGEPMTDADRKQLLQLALSFADRTL